MSLKVDKFVYGSGKALNKISENTDSGQIISRELQMVPKYLECVKLSGKESYRFNETEIKDLTAAFKKYETNLPMTDVLKELLSIGNDGNVKPLNAEEIKAFLKATSGMRNQEQNNVLNFLKESREEFPQKVTIESLKAKYPYEKFKVEEYELDKRYQRQEISYSEEHMQKRYNGLLEYEFQLMTNPYYGKVLKSNVFSFGEHLRNNNTNLIKAVSEIPDAKALSGVFQIAGARDNVISAAKDFVEIYNMSNGNKYLIKDLSELFYPSEIKHICEALKAAKVREKATLTEYIGARNDSRAALNTERHSVLSLLEIEDSVELLPLRYVKNEDIYPSKEFGEVRGRRISSGNYEHGKKK